jgi:hypothetical protein
MQTQEAIFKYNFINHLQQILVVPAKLPSFSVKIKQPIQETPLQKAKYIKMIYFAAQ